MYRQLRAQPDGRSALAQTTELERIADHGKKIARICQRISSESRPIPLAAIATMGQVDALYKQTFNVALSYMLESPRAISAGTYLIQVGHELERVADRATNIAERVIYMVRGELVDLNA